MTQQRMSTGEAIVDGLIHHGVEQIFGIPGAHTYAFIDALYGRRNELKYIGTRHEQGAAYMAFGYAKSSGKVGVFTCVPGPGVLNAGAALCTAYGANTPVLCITGEIWSHEIGRGHGILHELPDQLATLRGLTKWSERINHPTEAPALVARAFEELTSGRTRPVALECPWDTLGQRAMVQLGATAREIAPPLPDPEAIDKAAKLLATAVNPLIMLGSGALGAGAEVSELSQLLQAPVTAHRSGRGIVSEDSPYGMAFAAAHHHWQKTDVLVAIGTRMELQFIRWRKLPPGLKIIRIEVDAAEIQRRTVDVAILSDARLGTRALNAALANLPARKSRASEFEAIKAQARKEIEVVQPQLAYLDAIRAVLPRDGFFVEEISQMGFTARFGFPVYQPRTYVTGGYQDNLGFGYMTALGVKVANPTKAVVSVSGDGGFMFGVQELATAAQYNIGCVAIVFNNQSFGNVLRDQKQTYGGRYLGERLRNPDFVKLAESFGVRALRATTPTELRTALDKVLALDGPTLIEVPGEAGSEASPWPFIHPA